MHPTKNDYAPYYQRYIDLVKGNEVIPLLESQIEEFTAFIKSIPDDKKNHSYAEGKWTVAEVIGHIIDVERVMAFRAFWFARNDPKPLPGFEHDDFVKIAGYNNRSFQSLADEWIQLRKSNILLFKTFDKDALQRRGVASNKEITSLALIFIVAGHLTHHSNILKERYLYS